jgi:hypothetical protein
VLQNQLPESGPQDHLKQEEEHRRAPLKNYLPFPLLRGSGTCLVVGVSRLERRHEEYQNENSELILG